MDDFEYTFAEAAGGIQAAMSQLQLDLVRIAVKRRSNDDIITRMRHATKLIADKIEILERLK